MSLIYINSIAFVIVIFWYIYHWTIFIWLYKCVFYLYTQNQYSCIVLFQIICILTLDCMCLHSRGQVIWGAICFNQIFTMTQSPNNTKDNTDLYLYTRLLLCMNVRYIQCVHTFIYTEVMHSSQLYTWLAMNAS